MVFIHQQGRGDGEVIVGLVEAQSNGVGLAVAETKTPSDGISAWG
jgi:hypothetical protein